MRHVLWLLIVLGTVSLSAYTWFAKWTNSTAAFYINPANADNGLQAGRTDADVVAAIQAAMSAWNSAGSPFTFTYAGAATDTTTANDGRNVILFRNDADASAVAFTYGWWNATTLAFLDADVVFFDGWVSFYTNASLCGSTPGNPNQQTVGNAAYIQDVATHELGHALGLHHSTVAEATMAPNYAYCSTAMRTLAADDIAGLQFLYGSGSTSTGGSTPAITTPGAGATLAGSSQAFTWTAGSGATSYWLYVGTTPGGADLFNLSTGASLTATATGLPTDGRKLYARLWWLRNGAWEYADTVYTASTGSGSGSGGGSVTDPVITTPSAGATLSGSSQAFTWTSGNATYYWLYLGSIIGGTDLFNRDLGSGRSVTVTGLPTDGRPIYARLWWRTSTSGWMYADTTYRAK